MTTDPHAVPPDRIPGAVPAAVPAALSAFLRGIERRGAVLAELQCADPVAGDAALAAAMRAFRTVGPGEPMARWPLRFWALLLATPQLRRPLTGGRGDPDAAWLAQLPPGPRAAILLRLAAGLDEADAAQALAIARPVYRRALRRALPRRDDGRADPAAWLRLRAHVHRRIKTLPDDRLSHLAQLREDALAGRHVNGHGPMPPTRRHPRWLLPSLRAGALACAVLFVATFVPWWRLGGELRKEALPIERPAATFDEQTALLTHRDFALLADPRGAALSEQLAFQSWLANQSEIEEAREAAEADSAQSGVDVTTGATAAPTDPGVLVEMRRQAWEAMSDGERALFRQRMEAWDALSPDVAGAQREAYLSLQELDGAELATLRQTRDLFESLPTDTQRELRDRFDELTVTEQRGWLLGPGLGADFAGLSPLFLQVPPEQREPLLALLRRMSPEERDDLAVLAYRTPAQEREALRRALLETTDANRAAWLRLRLER